MNLLSESDARAWQIQMVGQLPPYQSRVSKNDNIVLEWPELLTLEFLGDGQVRIRYQHPNGPILGTLTLSKLSTFIRRYHIFEGG